MRCVRMCVRVGKKRECERDRMRLDRWRCMYILRRQGLHQFFQDRFKVCRFTNLQDCVRMLGCVCVGVSRGCQA